MASWLSEAGVAFEFEPSAFPYSIPVLGVPDFRLVQTGVYVEAKGYWDSEDRRRFIYLRDALTELGLEIRLLFQRSGTRIGKGKRFPRTYGEWATHHGITWAEGPNVPPEWLEE